MKQILAMDWAVVQSDKESFVLNHPTTIFTDDNVMVEIADTEETLNYKIARLSVASVPTIPKEGEKCDKDKIYRYGDNKVKCLQEHSRMHFTPEQTPALWLIIPTITEGFPVWKQPTGAHDAYKIGEIVHYPDINGKLWRSKINANTTKPDGDVPYNRYWEPYKKFAFGLMRNK